MDQTANCRALEFHIAIATWLILSVSVVTAATNQWNSTIDGIWSKPGNWTLSAVPATTDDVQVGTVVGSENTRVTMDMNDTIASLLMASGTEFSTADFELIVNGQATLKNANTRFLVKDNLGANSFDTEGLEANDGTTVQMLGGVIEIESGFLDTNTGSRLEGFGRIDFETTNAIAWSNNGDVYVGNSLDSSIPIADVAKTLQLTTSGGGTLDLDNSGTVTIGRAGTFDIDGTVNDAVSNTWEMFANSTLDISTAWSRNAGNLNINTEAGFFATQPAGTATITGGTFSLTGGSINLNNAADHLVLDATFNATGGVINLTEGRITFNNPATIGPGATFSMGSSTEIDINSTVNITANWDWDGVNGLDNTINIGDFGTLNVGSAAVPTTQNVYLGDINFNGGRLNVQAVGDEWAAEFAEITAVSGTTSTISGDTFRHGNGSMTSVQVGATLDVNSPIIFDMGVVTVGGVLDLNGGTEFAGGAVNGSGQLDPGFATVTSSQIVSVGIYNWDTGTLTLNPGTSLTLNVSNVDTGGSDEVNSTTNVNSATLEVNNLANEWQLGSGGDLNLTNTGAGTPTLQGAALRVVTTGRIDADGDVDIEAPLILGEGSTPGTGTVLNLTGAGGTVRLNGPVTLDGGDILDDINRTTADSRVEVNDSLVVTGDSTIDVETFDWEGSPGYLPFEVNTTTVMPGATLRVLAGNLDSQDPFVTDNLRRFDGRLEVQSATVHVNLANHNSWLSDNVIILTNTDGTPSVLSGDLVEIGNGANTNDASLFINGVGLSRIEAPIRFLADTKLQVLDAATLYLASNTTFDSLTRHPALPATTARYQGSGSLLLGGNTNINESTILEVGHIDLDGGPSDTAGNIININAPTRIEANILDDFGNNNAVGTNVLNISEGGQLLVDQGGFDPQWTITEHAVVNLSGPGGGVQGGIISIDRVNIHGTVNVDKTAGFAGEVVLTGTLNVPDPDDQAQFFGFFSNDKHRIQGGQIVGMGQITADSGDSLLGFGEINTNINYLNTARLLADDGTLNINGTIFDVGTIGTDDDDGVLNIANPWQTSVADAVSLDGGELTGGIITNDLSSGITGHGLISAPVINNMQISAFNGELIVGTATTNSDFDGAGPSAAGVLQAIQGSMRLRQADPSFSFSGTINVDTAFYIEGFSMTFNPDSELNLTSGDFNADQHVQFNGPITVDSFTSRLDAPATIGVTSTVDLDGDLRIGGNVLINNGAAFTGTADLVVGGEAVLTVDNGASVGVNIDNQGALAVGTTTGLATVDSLKQFPGSHIGIDIGGLVAGAEHDKLIVTGLMTLGGVLDVDLINAFLPALGDNFDIFDFGSATASFSMLNLPALGPDLAWDTTNLLVDGTLSVVNAAPAGDFDLDFDVDGADFLEWQRGFGSIYDGDDLADWETNFAMVALLAANSAAVPEPTSLVLLSLGGLLALRNRCRATVFTARPYRLQVVRFSWEL